MPSLKEMQKINNNTKAQVAMLAELLRPHLREGEDADALAEELVTDFNLRFVTKSYWKRSSGGYFVCPECSRVRPSNEYEFCDCCGAMMLKRKPKKNINKQHGNKRKGENNV